MRFWVGLTDKGWYEQLMLARPDEVNFWQPSGRRAVHLAPGTPFLFKLHSPHNFIVGGGFFVRFSTLPARIAWDAFGEKNGVRSYLDLRTRVQHYRGEESRGDPEIGCNVLNGPFFWTREDWIPIPESWKSNIVKGRTFDTDQADGRDLWLQVETRLHRVDVPGIGEAPRFGAEYLTRARLGQGAFRVLVTEAYQRRCAITGEKTLPVLQAAHIRSYANEGPHAVANGILLRSDMHTLFDRGYITIDTEHRVEVSRRLREEFENGREYYQFRGQSLKVLPNGVSERPSANFLRWHNEQVFLG